jgi:16S rRNA (adenine(1408)-N(1))-methyltransferase
VIVDLGTGDGKAVLAAAAADARALVIGLDADASAMAESSRRAARPARTGGFPNALFVVASAERVPPALCGLADQVGVLFPWGSLLRGVLGLDDEAARGVAALLRPDGGGVDVLVSVTPRDGVGGIDLFDGPGIDRLAQAHRRFGLELMSAVPASVAEVRATRSSWGRRLLGSASDRPVWRLRLRRRPGTG